MNGGATASAAASGPREAYEERLALHRAGVARFDLADRRISLSRAGMFLAGVIIAWLALGPRLVALQWIFAPIAVFAGLVVAHQGVIRRRRRAARAVAFHERGLARLDDRSAESDAASEVHAPPDHPYAADLDVFGQGSLFELLSTARTRGGEETLAAWLSAPAVPAIIRERQAAVAELRPRLVLREEIALLGDEIRTELAPRRLVEWGEAPRALRSGASRAVAFLLAGSAIAGLAVWQWTELGPTPFLVVIVIEAFLARRLGPRVDAVVRGIERAGRDLRLLAAILGRLEREPFESARLRELHSRLESGGEPPSRRIARLGRLVDLLDSRRNPFFAPIAAMLLWTQQVAFSIEAWRAVSGADIRRWLDTLGELEALLSIGSHAFDHPEDPFPEIVDGGPTFESEGLAHPLLPKSRAVRNDLCLGGGRSPGKATPSASTESPRVLVVSGSNMSGKSTLLRTVGTNAVLALAGAPVRARRLRISPLAVGASIRVLDSLQDGRSRFYAEILRLRQLLELADGTPALLFLLDEVLHGTNSHDRGVGAEAVVRSFAARGAIGLVTTHDLALAKVADALAPVARNVHFEDQLEGDRIAFDYRMRDGVVTKSNALALMRAVGLEV